MSDQEKIQMAALGILGLLGMRDRKPKNEEKQQDEDDQDEDDQDEDDQDEDDQDEDDQDEDDQDEDDQDDQDEDDRDKKQSKINETGEKLAGFLKRVQKMMEKINQMDNTAAKDNSKQIFDLTKNAIDVERALQEFGKEIKKSKDINEQYGYVNELYKKNLFETFENRIGRWEQKVNKMIEGSKDDEEGVTFKNIEEANRDALIEIANRLGFRNKSGYKNSFKKWVKEQNLESNFSKKDALKNALLAAFNQAFKIETSKKEKSPAKNPPTKKPPTKKTPTKKTPTGDADDASILMEDMREDYAKEMALSGNESPAPPLSANMVQKMFLDQMGKQAKTPEAFQKFLIKVFNTADTNDDGVLSLPEMRNFIRSNELYKYFNVPRKEEYEEGKGYSWTELFSKIDEIKKDDKLSLKEWITIVPNIMNSLKTPNVPPEPPIVVKAKPTSQIGNVRGMIGDNMSSGDSDSSSGSDMDEEDDDLNYDFDADTITGSVSPITTDESSTSSPDDTTTEEPDIVDMGVFARVKDAILKTKELTKQEGKRYKFTVGKKTYELLNFRNENNNTPIKRGKEYKDWEPEAEPKKPFKSQEFLQPRLRF